MFKDTKNFYKTLGTKNIGARESSSMVEVNSHWKSLWGEKSQHNERAEWIREQGRKINNMDWGSIQMMEITSFLSNAHNWKSPGNDQKRNYWLKAFPATHSHVAKNFSVIMEELEKVPDWLSSGITYLLPKSGDSKEVRD